MYISPPLLLLLASCVHSASASAPFFQDVPDPRLRPLQNIISALPPHHFPAIQLESRQGTPSDTLIPTGSTFDPCYLNIHCLPQRYCIQLSSIPAPILCPSSNSSCACLPALPRGCTADSQCPRSEVCAAFTTSTPFFCVSKYVFDTNPALLPAPTDPPPSPSPSPVAGVTFDFCQSPDQCLPGRACRYFPQLVMFSVSPFEQPLELCQSRDPCICLPASPISCETSDGCPSGEVCVSLFNSTLSATVCISASTQNFLSLGFENRPIPSPRPLNESVGLTLDSCSDPTSFCSFGRACYAYPPTDEILCASDQLQDCRCYPRLGPQRCNRNRQCERGEVCAVETSSGRRICMSAAAVNRQPRANVTDTLGPRLPPSPEAEPEESGEQVDAESIPTPEADGAIQSDDESDPPAEATPAPDEEQEPSSVVCIGADALQHLERGELVYAQDVWAWVLCDGNGSCATAGHMVVYEGRAMRMGRYCGMVGCERRKMMVNSPKRRAGLRVGSRSGGLEFTAFAARYETVVEEMVLAAAVRVGL